MKSPMDKRLGNYPYHTIQGYTKAAKQKTPVSMSPTRKPWGPRRERADPGKRGIALMGSPCHAPAAVRTQE